MIVWCSVSHVKGTPGSLCSERPRRPKVMLTQVTTHCAGGWQERGQRGEPGSREVESPHVSSSGQICDRHIVYFNILV